MRQADASTLAQGYEQRDSSRDKLDRSMGQLCPEEVEVLEAIRATGAYISPSKLHAIYQRVTASADTDYDFGAAVLTMIRRGGSVAVDRTVGERVVRKQMRRAA